MIYITALQYQKKENFGEDNFVADIQVITGSNVLCRIKLTEILKCLPARLKFGSASLFFGVGMIPREVLGQVEDGVYSITVFGNLLD